MIGLSRRVGLTPHIPSPAQVEPASASDVESVLTEEAALHAGSGRPMLITPLVEEGDLVAQGAALACLRHAPDICLAAPIAGRVGKIALLPGRKLSEIVLFREEGGVAEHDIRDAGTSAGLRRLMQAAGAWPLLRRRPFGGMPGRAEIPAAIVVMAADTRPLAADPHNALDRHERDLALGLAALARLTEGPVLLCQSERSPHIGPFGDSGRIRTVICGARHPQGCAGIRIHDACPAGLDAPVWEIHAEDTAALGRLTETGVLPMLRQVRIAGSGLREGRTLRTHPGADLRQLAQALVAPGPHILMSGSPLDGRVARWLGPRDRQVTVLPRDTAAQQRPHWLVAALTRSATAKPAIPTAALSQALGGGVPAVPLIRAIGSHDDETAMRLGVLSLLEDDIALADYVLNEGGKLKAQLRAMLDRIEQEYGA